MKDIRRIYSQQCLPPASLSSGFLSSPLTSPKTAKMGVPRLVISGFCGGKHGNKIWKITFKISYILCLSMFKHGYIVIVSYCPCRFPQQFAIWAVLQRVRSSWLQSRVRCGGCQVSACGQLKSSEALVGWGFGWLYKAAAHVCRCGLHMGTWADSYGNGPDSGNLEVFQICSLHVYAFCSSWPPLLAQFEKFGIASWKAVVSFWFHVC